MRSAILLAALCGLTSAAAAILTDPISVEKRGALKKRVAPCGPEPGGAGPVPGDGSVAAYHDPLNSLSVTALAAITPLGYIATFVDMQATVEEVGYITFRTLESAIYDVLSCADFCNSTAFCRGFNIYYERDPKINPAPSCPNPVPVTNIKCSLYGFPVFNDTATNTGHLREAFQVTVAGSNGYSKVVLTSTTLTNFSAPSTLLPGAIDVSLDPLVSSTYLGNKLYSGGPYDPALCAATCQAQTAANRAAAGIGGTYKPCNFFNAYILFKNNIAQGTSCSFYTRALPAIYATNVGYNIGSDRYRVADSFTYALATPDPGRV